MGMAGPGGGKKKRPMADINVTPMVDVMLVLLVIFVITAPVIKQIDGLQVNLPREMPGQPTETIVTEDARTLVISPEGFVVRPGSANADDHYQSMAALIEDLKIYKEDSDKAQKAPVVVIAGDREARWEKIMQVWNAVKSAGITQVSFQVDSNAPAKTEETP
jgi:biopolymer transport protein TolR